MIKTYQNNQEFYSLPLYTDSRVLIPRNETEILVDKVLKEIKNNDYILIDIGTGSACIPISIFKNSKNINQIFAFDISFDALEVAKININKYNLKNKIILLHSDLLEIIINGKIKIKNKNIIITANLPYIKNHDFENINKEVLAQDPHIALFGGEKTGFEMYERLINQIFEFKKISKNNIILFIEIGFDQYEYSKKYLSNLKLKFEYFKDFGGVWRVIKIEF